LIGHLYSNGMWFGVTPRTTTGKTYVRKEIGLCAQNTITILDAIVNAIEGGAILPFDEHKNLHSGNE
jgi:hypothetical protein